MWVNRSRPNLLIVTMQRRNGGYHNRYSTAQPKKMVQVPCTLKTATARTQGISRSSLDLLATAICAAIGETCETFCGRIAVTT